MLTEWSGKGDLMAELWHLVTFKITFMLPLIIPVCHLQYYLCHILVVIDMSWIKGYGKKYPINLWWFHYSQYLKKNGKKFCDKINIVMKYRILKINLKKLLFREGCGMAEIWDIEDKKNRHESVQACTKLRERPEPYFSRVFRNDIYDVLKVSKW